MDKFSYSLGIVLAQNLKNQDITTFDPVSLAKGLEDIIKGNPLEVNPEDANQLIQNYLREAAVEKHKGNIEIGEAFLTENGKKAGITTLPSGLQYEVMETGGGGIPHETDEVTTHYHGTLLDGTVFDSSVERGEPAKFPVNRVIPAWVEALQLMSVGSKWRLFVPSNLAYGDQGAGEVIKPYSTLIFEVELLGIN
ncbi:MAG: FKBP-type peptidyl-prolyl cis-trans isomerase FklB [Saprospiraceae bacterium]|jgi:FKBP-type peptidyl-prolyl cis-trans isomerase FklB